ncbi:hypothetical protein M9Y10_044133 [Tritrichomonas musculus]|uniref:E2F/DP family winged-helix DNA-binding domain-containing protein n=1 Tax=Tritrichomonas musculus TaxID=1915356 RepID=A0ABR2K4K1_9EUKA
MLKKDKEKNSLTNLTQRFLQVLSTSSQNEVDLVDMEAALNITKRRLYDITNVLFGAGIIEHSGKSKVKMIQKSLELNEEKGLAELAMKEREIDIMKEIAERELDILQNSDDFQNFAYFTEEDIKKLGQQNPLNFFAFRSPSDLKLEVVEDDDFYKLLCTSDIGGVDLIEIK